MGPCNWDRRKWANREWWTLAAVFLPHISSVSKRCEYRFSESWWAALLVRTGRELRLAVDCLVGPLGLIPQGNILRHKSLMLGFMRLELMLLGIIEGGSVAVQLVQATAPGQTAETACF